jgi:cell wall-associated NlpC family hydrolase
MSDTENKNPKGSAANPYTEEEYKKMCKEETWKGGYVEGISGYVSPEVSITGSYSSEMSSDDEDSWSEDSWAQEFQNISNSWNDEDKGSSDNQYNNGSRGNTQSTWENSTSSSGGTTIVATVDVAENNSVELGDDINATLVIYSYNEAERMMASGTWKGGYVEGYGYMLPEVKAMTIYNFSNSTGLQILNRAYAFTGVPYKWGGTDANGIDCSGLVTATLGLNHRWTTHSGDIPGMTRVYVTHLSENNLDELMPGDILVWPNRHVVFYVGDGKIFHAHGGNGHPTGTTNDLSRYWMKNFGIPKIYRKY